MLSAQYRNIDDWTEATLVDLPAEESDLLEYKSSLIKLDELKREIGYAASAFWNSGGGIFIAGVDDSGKIDGGIADMIGNQRVRDWADQLIAMVEPNGDYTIKTIGPDGPDSAIRPGCVVLVIAFADSSRLPHMAPDKRYYVRAGAHSVRAGHFLVEAIRSRRNLHEPVLRGLLRAHEYNPGALQLVVLTLNEAPALEVEIDFNPRPQVDQHFPVTVPVVNTRFPFVMELSRLSSAAVWFERGPVTLSLRYRDISGRTFEDSQLIDPSATPDAFHTDPSGRVMQVLQALSGQLARLNEALADRYRDPEV